MTALEELGIVVGIFAGIYTLSRGFGGNSCNASAVPASQPSGTVQTAPFAGAAPSIPVPTLTNPFVLPPSYQPPVSCGGSAANRPQPFQTLPAPIVFTKMAQQKPSCIGYDQLQFTNPWGIH